MAIETTAKATNAIQKELLFKMKFIRGVEETIAERYNEQKMRCPTHLCTGQEAVAAAAGTGLTIQAQCHSRLHNSFHCGISNPLGIALRHR